MQMYKVAEHHAQPAPVFSTQVLEKISEQKDMISLCDVFCSLYSIT